MVDAFNKIVTTCKNLWTIGGIVGLLTAAVYAWLIQNPSLWYALPVALFGATTIGLFLYAERLRRKVERYYRCFDSIHLLTHQIRDTLDKEGAAIDAYATVDEKNQPEGSLDDLTERREDAALKELLVQILDKAQIAYSELTGKNVTALILMPCISELDGRHFKAYLYSGNACSNRKKSSSIIKGGLAQKAFNADAPLYFPNLKSEMQKGNFVKGRSADNPFQWYRSAVMAHFKVGGERYGVLSIDCVDEKAFREKQLPLLAAFADACALAFNLSDFGILGNIAKEYDIIISI